MVGMFGSISGDVDTAPAMSIVLIQEIHKMYLLSAVFAAIGSEQLRG